MSTTKRVNLHIPPEWIFQYDSQSWTNSDVITGSPGSLIYVVAGNKSASTTLYLMLFDASTVPANTAVPLLMPIILAPASTPSQAQLSINDIPGKRFYAEGFANGLVWAASTTPNNLTVDTSSSVWVTARYVG